MTFKIKKDAKCPGCKSSERPHHAKGLCKTCYMRIIFRNKGVNKSIASAKVSEE